MINGLEVNSILQLHIKTISSCLLSIYIYVYIFLYKCRTQIEPVLNLMEAAQVGCMTSLAQATAIPVGCRLTVMPLAMTNMNIQGTKARDEMGDVVLF